MGPVTFSMTTPNSFCKVVAEVTQCATPSSPIPSSSSDNSFIESALEGMIAQEIESESIMHEDEDEARGGDGSINRKTIPDDLFFRVQRAGDRLVSMASQLAANKTTNLAECYMNMRCKFDGGKFYNRIQRGGFQHRCYGADLQFQMGSDWSSQVWSRATGTEPGEITLEHNKKSKHEHSLSTARKSTLQYKEQRKRTKYVYSCCMLRIQYVRMCLYKYSYYHISDINQLTSQQVPSWHMVLTQFNQH